MAPRLLGSLGGNACPDIFELTDGDFAVIGTDRTNELCPPLACGKDQRIVVIPRRTLVCAKAYIPDA